jgi:hypothetical protein
VAVLAGVALLVALVGALRMLGLLYVQVTLVIARIVAAPEGYGHIQHVDMAQDPKFIEQILARVTE